MRRIDRLRDEFERETTTARSHLARLTDAHWQWRPHQKSFAAGDLALHIGECVRWTATVFGADVFDFDPRDFVPLSAGTASEMLRAFDGEVTRGLAAIANSPDADVSGTWTLKIAGRTRFTRNREDAFRDMSLHHLIHHRGQLSVYLRLLNIAVPGTYGPTADDM